MKYLCFIFLLFSKSTFSFQRASLDCNLDNSTLEADMTACQLASSKGIPFEVHDDVITEDNYVITMHRLPRNDSKRRYPVLLMHGLLQSSDVWLLNERNKSLAWILWDKVSFLNNLLRCIKLLNKKKYYKVNAKLEIMKRGTMYGWGTLEEIITLAITRSSSNMFVKM